MTLHVIYTCDVCGEKHTTECNQMDEQEEAYPGVPSGWIREHFERRDMSCFIFTWCPGCFVKATTPNAGRVNHLHPGM